MFFAPSIAAKPAYDKARPMDQSLHDARMANGVQHAAGRDASHAMPLVEGASESIVYDPGGFGLADMVRCGSALRRLVGESASMEDGAQSATRFLYEHLRVKGASQRCCALVRFFKTHPYAGLSQELRAFALSVVSGAALSMETKCLTLLASTGDEPQWNARRASKGHQSIPLVSEAMVERFPMIAQLVRQLGLTTAELVRTPAGIIRELEQRRFGVFHVPVAAGSPFVPAQRDFVEPQRIASVLGFGGILPDGELFAMIMFARVSIPAATADMFRTVALNLKLGLLALLDKPVFAA